MSERPHVELSWFAALCDDDTEYLGVPDPGLASSWEHCRDIVLAAERNGFDSVLLPSGYAVGIDATAFAAAIATHTDHIGLLLAVRMGETWLPQLARQLATIDRMSGGRLTINIISSDLPGQQMESAQRYQRTREWMRALRALLDGSPLDAHGAHVHLQVDPPKVATVGRACPLFYFGGFSDAAKDVAASDADVYLTWPDTVDAVKATVTEMRERSAAHGRELRFGLRVHMIVRESEAEARRAAIRLVSRLDDGIGDRIRARSLDATSVGVQRQAELRAAASGDGFVEAALWTGIGRARSGAGAAIVGDPEQVLAKLDAYRDCGIDTFILSGYPHLDECHFVAQHVLQRLPHAALTR